LLFQANKYCFSSDLVTIIANFCNTNFVKNGKILPELKSDNYNFKRKAYTADDSTGPKSKQTKIIKTIDSQLHDMQLIN